MESFGDKARAVLYSLLLHGILVLLIVMGLWWTTETRPVVMPGPIIEATLVGPTSGPKPSSRKPKPAPVPPKPVETQPVEEAKPEPPKPTPPKPEPVKPEVEKAPPPEPPKQDLIEQQRIAALAEQKAEDAKKEQEAKKRREQILLDQEKKAEAERQKQLDEVRKQLAAAEKKKNLEKERLQQMQDKRVADQQRAEKDHMSQLLEQESKEAQTGAGGQDNDLTARYAAAIQAAVTRNWNRPESIPAGLRCTLRIVQIPGGDVISANVTSPCNADAAARNSIEQAVMRAAPLPYQGYEKVFSREINFNFKYDGQG